MTLIQTPQVPNAIALLMMMKMMIELVCSLDIHLLPARGRAAYSSRGRIQALCA
jgi:hypothetical protein